jgi:4-hydroxy-4-methyl-2-oxoglutarate aldolase
VSRNDLTNEDILKLYDGLRVADVRDGMDWAGLHHRGTVSREIRPLFQGPRMLGRAFTVRSRPTDKVLPHLTGEEYTEWAYSYWYKEVAIQPWSEELQPGDVVVIEGHDLNVGEVGSNNSLGWRVKGATGVVTSGGVRDSDECIRQGLPIFARYRSQAMTQGRIEYAGAKEPVAVGDVQIRQGDIVVGDGDGVIVVPIEYAEQVAQYGRQELENDKRTRRRYYEQLGWELDDTVA